VLWKGDSNMEGVGKGLFLVLEESHEPCQTKADIKKIVEDSNIKHTYIETKLAELEVLELGRQQPKTSVLKEVDELKRTIRGLKIEVGTPILNNTLLAQYTGQRTAHKPNKSLAELQADDEKKSGDVSLTALDIRGKKPHSIDAYNVGGVAVLANLAHGWRATVECININGGAWLRVLPDKIFAGMEIMWDYSCKSDVPSDLLIDCKCGCGGKLFKPM
jgi:hypothetical protein